MSFSIYTLKGRFQALLRPLVGVLQRAGVSANQVTTSAALASIAVAALVAWQAPRQPLLWALLPVWMFLRMALNAIDGMLAREFAQQSRLGAYLNETGDVVADAALYLALLGLPGVHAAAAWALAWAAAFSEYCGVLGLMVGAGRRYDGPMGKSDRAFAFSCLALLLASGYARKAWTDSILWGMALLLLITIFNRSRHALAEAAEKGKINF